MTKGSGESGEEGPEGEKGPEGGTPLSVSARKKATGPYKVFNSLEWMSAREKATMP